VTIRGHHVTEMSAQSAFMRAPVETTRKLKRKADIAMGSFATRLRAAKVVCQRSVSAWIGQRAGGNATPKPRLWRTILLRAQIIGRIEDGVEAVISEANANRNGLTSQQHPKLKPGRKKTSRSGWLT
jgi:hypothetical protein